MTRKIAQLGQPILRQPANDVSLEQIQSSDFQQLVDDMMATMVQEKGAGLAGPQVFQDKRLFIGGVLSPTEPDGPAGVEVFVNPKIVAASEETATAWEGCLSFPELLVLVRRALAVRVDYLNRHGETRTMQVEGFPARVIQHEYDHLNGILTIDRIESTRDIIKASEIEVVRGV
jgi:peptide deformylase